MTPPLATASEPLRAIMRSFEFTATATPAAGVRRAPLSAERARAAAEAPSKTKNRK